MRRNLVALLRTVCVDEGRENRSSRLLPSSDERYPSRRRREMSVQEGKWEKSLKNIGEGAELMMKEKEEMGRIESVTGSQF
jgi:hypothetical protein